MTAIIEMERKIIRKRNSGLTKAVKSYLLNSKCSILRKQVSPVLDLYFLSYPSVPFGIKLQTGLIGKHEAPRTASLSSKIQKQFHLSDIWG